MFERIVVRRHDIYNETIDVGKLAEALLFYENVHLLLDGSGLRSLLRQIGADLVLNLQKEKRVTITFIRDFLGTQSNTPIVGAAFHRFVAARLHAHADGRRIKNRNFVEDAFVEVLGRNKLALAKAERFLKHTKFQDYVPSNLPIGSRVNSMAVTAQANGDLDDNQYVMDIVKAALNDIVPDYVPQANWHVGVIKRGEEFSIQSNLDIAAINAAYKQRGGLKDHEVTLAWLVCHVLDVRGDLHFASEYMAELATDSLRAKLLQIKFNDFVRRHVASGDEIGEFQNIFLKNAFAIREAINSGDHTFAEFMNLLDQAGKFKSWLRDVHPDARLLNEYFDAATRDTWAQKLPTKGSRFAVFTAAGVGLDAVFPSGGLGTTIGVGLGAIDAFWLDRFIKGWRPNQFIDGPLKRFIDD